MIGINPLPFTTLLADSCMDSRIIEHHTSGRTFVKLILSSRQDTLTSTKDVTRIIRTACFSHLHSLCRSDFSVATDGNGTCTTAFVF